MNFKNLPKKLKNAIFKLTKDEEFQKRFADDEVLDSLEELKYDKSIEYKSLFALLGKEFPYNNKYKFKQLTPAKLVFLYIYDSIFLKSKINIDDIKDYDIDFFLYYLNECNVDEELTVIAEKSLNYHNKIGLDFYEAIDIILNIIKVSFYPLSMFPSNPNKDNSKNIAYDADWLASLIACVHQVTGESPDYIANKMSLNACCYYFVQHARINGDKTVYKHSPEEILKAMDDRASELVVDRLIELKVIKSNDKSKYLNIITNADNQPK